MQKILKVLNAVIGFAGSSESPEKMSLRMIAIIMGVSAKFTPAIIMFVSFVGVTLPEGVTPENVSAQIAPIVQVVAYFTAATLWLVGASRAAYSAWNVGGRLRGIINRGSLPR